MEQIKHDAAVSDLGLRRIKTWDGSRLGEGSRLGPRWAGLRRFGPTISC